MFSLLYSCCQSSNDIDSNYEKLLFTNTYTHSNLSLNKYLSDYLENKLGLFAIFSVDKDLLIFNDIKQEKSINIIINEAYKEIYKKKDEQMSVDFIKENNIHFKEKIIIIFNINEQKQIAIHDSIKDNEINLISLKKLILSNQYKNIIVPTEPKENSNEVATLIIRSPDGKVSLTRKFKSKDCISSIYSYVKSKTLSFFNGSVEVPKYELIVVYPYKKLTNVNNTIESEGLCPSATIQIQTIEK